jgi:hypothetical protein
MEGIFIVTGLFALSYAIWYGCRPAVPSYLPMKRSLKGLTLNDLTIEELNTLLLKYEKHVAFYKAAYEDQYLEGDKENLEESMARLHVLINELHRRQQ